MGGLPEGFERRLAAALELNLPYDQRLQKADGIRAAVLILFSQSPDPAILFTVRSQFVETHKGQISFPGGTCDPEDSERGHDESHVGEIITALRETEEEVGISRRHIRVLGRMPDLMTVTGFIVTPIVGVLTVHQDAAPVVASPEEIAEYFWAQLSRLTDPNNYRIEPRAWQGVNYSMPVYQIGTHKIWGVTAAILKNLLDRIGSVK